MELKINQLVIPEAPSFNYDELKGWLTEKCQTYETILYTEDNIKQARADKANLNKLKKALNDERIRREREYMEPFNQFKGKINEIIAVIDKPIAVIDRQIKAADDKRKADKQLEIGSLFIVKRFPDWVRIDMIQDPSWLNATTSMKQIEDNLDGWKNRISAELKTIEGLQEFSFEATEVYKKTLDMAKAIAEGQRLVDIQKRKKEAEEAAARMKAEADARRTEAEAKRQQEEAEKAAEEAVKQETPKTDAPASWIKFEALLTVENAGKLREFFIDNGIEFKAI